MVYVPKIHQSKQGECERECVFTGTVWSGTSTILFCVCRTLYSNSNVHVQFQALGILITFSWPFALDAGSDKCPLPCTNSLFCSAKAG